MENWVLRRLMHFRTFCPVRRPASWVIVAALFVAGGCGGDGDDKGPTATIAKADRTTTTEARTPEEQVESAYLKSWDVYANALRHLDDSEYEAVFSGDALTLRVNELSGLKVANTPVRVVVEHHYSITVFDNDQQAVVLDAYENHSVLIDPKTGEPTEPDPNKTVKREYQFRKVNGTWKIVHVFDVP
jgi:hypothetical protein